MKSIITTAIFTTLLFSTNLQAQNIVNSDKSNLLQNKSVYFICLPGSPICKKD